MTHIIDADSHLVEPLDLWQRYVEPQYRSRCLRFARRPDKHRYMLLVEDKTPLRLYVEDLLGVLIGFGVWALLSTTGLGDWLTTLFSLVKREIPLCAEASPGCVPSTPAPGEGLGRSGLSR